MKYEPNSHKYKDAKVADEKKKVEKITTGKVKVRKKNELRKLTDVFISEDADDVKSYIFMDVLVPAIKKAVFDTVEMLLYGNDKSRKTSSASRISYRDYYEKDKNRRNGDNRYRTGYSYDDIVLDNRGEAEEILDRMDELIDTYGLVSVADFYDLAGITSAYTDNKYGWTNLRNASVVKVRDGYMIKLPKALLLD